MKRTLPALALVALLVLAGLPVGASAATAPADTSVAQVSTNATSNNSTAPTMASQVRISPVDFEASYLQIRASQPDAAYNTSGEFAMFSLSESVDAARIAQTPATAQVLQGGHAVKVIYKPDAAPPDSESLYELELFFSDGSRKTVDLYASNTEQSVAAASLQDWQPVIDDAQEFASDHGYETSPEAVGEYLSWVNERADLVEGWLSDKAIRAVFWVVQGISNPLVILLGLMALGGWMLHRQRQHGDVIETLQRLAGRYQQKMDRLQNDYQKAKRTADDDRLDEVPQIGANADFYEDALGTKSPSQLARVAASGAVCRRDGDLEELHQGVEDLDPDDLRDSWLEPVLRHGVREKEALNHLLAAVRWMETEYQLGHLFRDTREQLEELLDELQEQESRGFAPGDD